MMRLTVGDQEGRTSWLRSDGALRTCQETTRQARIGRIDELGGVHTAKACDELIVGSDYRWSVPFAALAAVATASMGISWGRCAIVSAGLWRMARRHASGVARERRWTRRKPGEATVWGTRLTDSQAPRRLNRCPPIC